jgi:hypothetical protein
MFKGWVDLDRIAIPQADEQQRLLANLLVALSQTARPLPRLWYFPGSAETMLIATGDAHGNPASAVEDVLTRVEKRGGHMSVYYTAYPTSDVRRTARRAKRWVEGLPLVEGVVASPFATPAPPQIMDWRTRGHEIGLHPFVEEGLEAGWRGYWKEFTGLGYGPVPPTVRTHRILWTGWIETARVQASYGMRMNLDYYHVGPAFQNEAGEWVYGHFTGSGLPMRFVDQQGRILKIYQQLTQLTDEHLLAKMPWEGGWPKLSAEAAAEVSRTLLRRSLGGDHSAIATNFHVDPFAVGGEYASEATRWLEGTLDYAAANGVPIWSALEWLHFTEIRHDAGLEDVQWQPAVRRLSFRLVAQAAPEVDLTVMVPLRHRNAKLTQLKVDGLVVEHRERLMSGVSYGWLSVPAGPHQVVATYD